MTRIEAIKQLESLLSYCKVMLKIDEIWKPYYEALNIVIAALRGPTREQMEKLRGEVNKIDKFLYACSKCGAFIDKGDSFCCRCGVPLTDGAVDIVMQRLEALKDEAN
mgnify:CR=1 FL=1